MLTMTGRVEPQQVRQVLLEEGLEAVVVQADRVEHARGGLDRTGRRISDAGQGGDGLGDHTPEAGEVDIRLHLARIAERPRCHEDRIAEFEAVQ